MQKIRGKEMLNLHDINSQEGKANPALIVGVLATLVVLGLFLFRQPGPKTETAATTQTTSNATKPEAAPPIQIKLLQTLDTSVDCKDSLCSFKIVIRNPNDQGLKTDITMRALSKDENSGTPGANIVIATKVLPLKIAGQETLTYTGAFRSNITPTYIIANFGEM
jgi:hypothetical protein